MLNSLLKQKTILLDEKAVAMGCFSKLIEIDAQTHGDWRSKSMSLVVKVNEFGVSVQKAVVLVVILPAFYGLYPVI